MRGPAHLILGGRYMGKRTYAESLYGSLSPLCDLERDALDALEDGEPARFIVNLHLGVRRLMERGLDALEFFTAQDLGGKILIGDEIGAGVVPMSPFERRWRDETGALYQMLAKRATLVDRVWAGIPLRLKG